jgi:hypothetical protein
MIDDIRKKLDALEAYEMNILWRMREENMPWREEEAIDRELGRILEAKAKLRRALEGKEWRR